jgi:hypothetical protein
MNYCLSISSRQRTMRQATFRGKPPHRPLTRADAITSFSMKRFITSYCGRLKPNTTAPLNKVVRDKYHFFNDSSFLAWNNYSAKFRS